MASAVASILTGGALSGVSKIIDSIRGKSPEDAAKLAQTAADLEALRAKYASDFELAKINQEVQLNTIAGANIQTEEKQNRYTACARPSIIYAWIAIVLYNYIACSLLHRPQLPIPDLFWEISGVTITGYVFVRGTQDVLNRVTGGAGGSASLPFGVKLDSKGEK